MKPAFLPLLALCLASTLTAQEESSHTQAARELLQVSQAEKMMDQVMGQMDAMMDQSFQSAGLPPEAKAEWVTIKGEILNWMADFFSWKEMEPIYLEIYTSVLSEEEIRQITAFYKSPAGQALIAKMPALTQKSMEVTMARMQNKMPELQNRMQEKIVELKKKYPQAGAART